MGVIKVQGELPGPKSRALLDRRARCVAPGVAMTHPIFVAEAHGATLTDVDGNVFLDFTGGIGVLNFGHTHEEVVAAARSQLGKLTHTCFQVAGYEPYVDVAEKLCAVTPGRFDKRVMLVSTGAEAVENAVKIARGHTRRTGVVCFEHAFHGRTLLGMTLTGKATPYKVGGAYAPEVYRLPFPYPYRGHGMELVPEAGEKPSGKRLEKALKTVVRPEEVAAVLVEPVLGEGGFLPAPPAFLQELRAFCDLHGAVLIADEVQSGFARTGADFACTRLGVEPDLLTVAKSIAGGLPLAAVVGRAAVMDSIKPGGLGGTYAGNPVACAAAAAAIDFMRRNELAARAEALGGRLRQRFEKLALPAVGEVRGLGAMLALELVEDRKSKTPLDAAPVLARARAGGVLLLSAGTYGNVIRLLMPLTISDTELDEGLAVVEAALRHAA